MLWLHPCNEQRRLGRWCKRLFAEILTDRHAGDINGVVVGRRWVGPGTSIETEDDRDDAQRQSVERRGEMIYITMIVVETSQTLAYPLGDCAHTR